MTEYRIDQLLRNKRLAFISLLIRNKYESDSSRKFRKECLQHDRFHCASQFMELIDVAAEPVRTLGRSSILINIHDVVSKSVQTSIRTRKRLLALETAPERLTSPRQNSYPVLRSVN